MYLRWILNILNIGATFVKQVEKIKNTSDQMIRSINAKMEQDSLFETAELQRKLLKLLNINCPKHFKLVIRFPECLDR